MGVILTRYSLFIFPPVYLSLSKLCFLNSIITCFYEIDLSWVWRFKRVKNLLHLLNSARNWVEYTTWFTRKSSYQWPYPISFLQWRLVLILNRTGLYLDTRSIILEPTGMILGSAELLCPLHRSFCTIQSSVWSWSGGESFCGYRQSLRRWWIYCQFKRISDYLSINPDIPQYLIQLDDYPSLPPDSLWLPFWEIWRYLRWSLRSVQWLPVSQ